MKKFFKKYSSQLAFWLIPPNLLLTGNVNDDSKDARKMERERLLHEQEVVNATPKREITPAVAPIVKEPCHLYIEGAFIWWKPVLDGLETVVSGISDTDTLTTVKKGRVYKPKFEYEPGLKFALGWISDHDGWDLMAEFTWLAEEKVHSHTKRDSTKGLYSIYPISAEGVYSDLPVSSAQTQWKQAFYVVDLELGRKFFISRALTLRPNFGVKFACLKQSVNAQYAPLLPVYPFAGTVLVDIPTPSMASFDSDQKMWGVGVRGGVDTVWYFTKNWGLYADIAAAAIWSDINATTTETNQPGSLTTFNTKEKTRTITPIFEIAAGLRYQMWFNNDRCQFYGQAGWEQQIWSNFNHIPNQNLTRNGDFTLQGLTAKVGFAF